jgi:hypothetical protein
LTEISLDLQTPRGLPDLFATSTRLYWRYLRQLLLLAGVLVVPFEILVLVATSSIHTTSHLTTQQERQSLIFGIADFVLVIPVVSALQAHAVLLIGQGEHPHLAEVFRRSLRVLPTVVAASIITAIGVGVGLVAFVIPGVWLLIRLYVVAQTAAIEGTNWPTTLRRSFDLTRGSSWRILGMLVIIGLINLTLENVLGRAASNGGALADIAAVVVALVSQSFSALVGSLLYFDLRAREQPSGGVRA